MQSFFFVFLGGHSWRFFSGKFGEKSFAPPKISLLLHLCNGPHWRFEMRTQRPRWTDTSQNPGIYGTVDFLFSAAIANGAEGSQCWWCRRRGCRVCKCTPKNFDFLKIWAKSLKIRTKPPKYLEKKLKIWAKMALNVALLQKIVSQRLQENKWRPFFERSH